jgi:hypothetical protein
MHNKASLALAFVILAASGYGAVAAWAWPWKAALFPLVIGVPLFMLAAVEALWTLLGAPAARAPGVTPDAQEVPDPEYRRRMLIAIGWILAFAAAIGLIGFPLAVPLFVFLYLKLVGREGWILSTTVAACAWGFFYGVFDRLLHLPLPPGWLFALFP